MPDYNANRIRLAVQLTARERRLKRKLDRLVGRVSKQTSSSCGQITKTIIRDIRDCQCERVWRLSKGHDYPPVFGLGEVEYLRRPVE